MNTSIVIIVAVMLLAVLVLVRSGNERYLSTTYVNTPTQTAVYPTAVTDYYWWDRYINQPQINYSVLPWFPWLPYHANNFRRRPYRWWNRRWRR